MKLLIAQLYHTANFETIYREKDPLDPSVVLNSPTLCVPQRGSHYWISAEYLTRLVTLLVKV